MTFLDAYALVAFLTGGPAAPAVRALLREGNVAVATANLAEALDVSQRVRGLPISRATEILDPLFERPVAIVELDLPIAQSAARVRAQHYHRSSRPISLADAILVASAGHDDRIATADPDLLAVGTAEGVQVEPLPEQG